ncbi:MAG TPA: hypothetical protein VJ975_07580 [Candidatus Limnocylindria bacterium]|nr:hypothetical protein [Candidatus Limnocylindria bacterium]
MALRVVVEATPKRVFASALDWPGWSRGAKTEDGALTALLEYADRYAPVARRARVRFDPPATLRGVSVVERLEGGAGTDFGIPSVPSASEDGALDARELKRLVALLRGSWAEFDGAAKKAHGVSLRLGPRGGGRQVPKMVEHVREAEAAYVAQLGTKVPGSSSIEQLRDAFLAALQARAAGWEPPDPNKVRKRWLPRYAVRRSAWHALDHAWEIQDRSS